MTIRPTKRGFVLYLPGEALQSTRAEMALKKMGLLPNLQSIKSFHKCILIPAFRENPERSMMASLKALKLKPRSALGRFKNL